MSSWSDGELDEHTRLVDDLREKFRSGDRYGEEYWHARRVFLTSYHFKKERYGFKEKLKKSARGIRDMAACAVEDVRHEVAKRRIGVRVFRVKVAVASLLVRSVRCFMPWLGKRELIE